MILTEWPVYVILQKLFFIRVRAWFNEIFAAVTSFLCSGINGSAPIHHTW